MAHLVMTKGRALRWQQLPASISVQSLVAKLERTANGRMLGMVLMTSHLVVGFVVAKIIANRAANSSRAPSPAKMARPPVNRTVQGEASRLSLSLSLSRSLSLALSLSRSLSLSLSLSLRMLPMQRRFPRHLQLVHLPQLRLP